LGMSSTAKKKLSKKTLSLMPSLVAIASRSSPSFFSWLYMHMSRGSHFASRTTSSLSLANLANASSVLVQNFLGWCLSTLLTTNLPLRLNGFLSGPRSCFSS